MAPPIINNQGLKIAEGAVYYEHIDVGATPADQDPEPPNAGEIVKVYGIKERSALVGTDKAHQHWVHIDVLSDAQPLLSRAARQLMPDIHVEGVGVKQLPVAKLLNRVSYNPSAYGLEGHPVGQRDFSIEEVKALLNGLPDGSVDEADREARIESGLMSENEFNGLYAEYRKHVGPQNAPELTARIRDTGGTAASVQLYSAMTVFSTPKIPSNPQDRLLAYRAFGMRF